MTLQEFILKYKQLCDYRGVDPLNPIDFIIQPFSDTAKTWTLICSVREPTFARMAYNILWMPLNLADPNYMKILRRVDHEQQSFSYRSLWAEMLDYDMLWEEDQYYRDILEDLSLAGIDSANDGVGPATTSVLGLVYLEPNPEGLPDVLQPVAVETNDSRMFNARYPTLHTHPDYARTMIAINETQYALVSKSFPPEPGMLLFLDAVNPNNPDEFIGIWRYPRKRDIQFVDRSLLSIEIRGLNSVAEKQTFTYEVWATFADGSSRQVVPDTFENELNSSAASINIGGTLTTADIATNTQIRLAASYTDNGITRSATKDVMVIAGLELLSLVILGPDEIMENTTSVAYTVRATFSDSSQSNVTPATFVSSIPATAVVNPNRSVTAGEVTGVTPFILTATYTFDGTTLTATKPVDIIEAPVVPVSLAILGPSPATIMEGQSFTFTFRVAYSDGSQVIFNRVNTFISSLSSVFSLAIDPVGDTSIGTAQSITATQTVRLDASYVESGITLNATFNITVTDVALPTGIEIFNGLLDFFEDSTQVYRARMRFDNNTTTTFTNSADTVWSIVTGGAHAQLNEHPSDGSALLQPNDISADQTVRIRVVGTYQGVDYTAEQNVVIRARLNTPTQLKIFESTVLAANFDSAAQAIDINAGSTDEFKFAAKMSFTPTAWTSISASDVDITYALASPSHGLTIALNPSDPTQVRVTVPAGLAANQTVNLVATYTRHGVQRSASYAINAKVVSTDISARWGVAPQQSLKANYTQPAFYNLLTNSLTGVNNEQITTQNSSGMSQLWYMLYPKAWGFLYVVDTVTNWAGEWDGAQLTTNDAGGTSAVEITINGKQYYVYRQSWPGSTGTTYRVQYGSSSPGSDEL